MGYFTTNVLKDAFIFKAFVSFYGNFSGIWENAENNLESDEISTVATETLRKIMRKAY